MKSLSKRLNESLITEGKAVDDLKKVLSDAIKILSNKSKGQKAFMDWQDEEGEGADKNAAEGWRVMTLKFSQWILDFLNDPGIDDEEKAIGLQNWVEATGYEDLVDEISKKYGKYDEYDTFSEFIGDIYVYVLDNSTLDIESMIEKAADELE